MERVWQISCWVFPGVFDVIATFSPNNALIKLDLPQLLLPTIAISWLLFMSSFCDDKTDLTFVTDKTAETLEPLSKHFARLY